MTPDFPNGSLVRLKSGGPLMTVARSTSDAAMVLCVWLDGASHAQKEWFYPACLMPSIQINRAF